MFEIKKLNDGIKKIYEGSSATETYPAEDPEYEIVSDYSGKVIDDDYVYILDGDIFSKEEAIELLLDDYVEVIDYNKDKEKYLDAMEKIEGFGDEFTEEYLIDNQGNHLLIYKINDKYYDEDLFVDYSDEILEENGYKKKEVSDLIYEYEHE